MTRIVESQEQVATTKLVETLEEQHILESLLESTKPPCPVGAEHYHYLIWTPFRYPPLPFGSRFGSRMHHGIFYASLALETALAECAYYRFVFLSGMSAPLPVDRLTTGHTVFVVRIETAYGVALGAAPFDQFAAEISSPSHYEASQSLGHAMREAGVEAFTYPSARANDAGINAGVLTLGAIHSHQPEQSQQWICTTTENKISFLGVHTKNVPPFSFLREQFMVNGELPVSAG